MVEKSKNPLTALTAGCIAGAVEATAVWPMEFIKVGLKSINQSIDRSGTTGTIFKDTKK